MKKTIWGALAVLAFVVVSPSDASAQDCVECVNVSPGFQDCVPGTEGTSCLIFYEEGDRWCNLYGTGECEGDGGEDPQGLMPNEVDPAGMFRPARGTYASTLRRVDDAAALVHSCTGYILTYRDPIFLHAFSAEVRIRLDRMLAST